MTTTATDLRTEWLAWHAEREAQLRTPHGWLSLTALRWLDEYPTAFPDLPGTWRITGDGRVTVAAAGELVLGGTPIVGTVALAPVDGQPGVLVEDGERRVEVVRDPRSPTLAAFTGVPAFDVDERWVVDARFTPYPEPRRITVDAVVDGLHHYPTALGTVAFTLDGAEYELVALAGKAGGLTLHFRDATSGHTTYGGGRILAAGDPGPGGALTLDLNRTLNLPCALTAFATCPLPPEENRLAVAVEAGERGGAGRPPGKDPESR